jgi:hypothetical protein
MTHEYYSLAAELSNVIPPQKEGKAARLGSDEEIHLIGFSHSHLTGNPFNKVI